jgi:hypothetical protein
MVACETGVLAWDAEAAGPTCVAASETPRRVQWRPMNGRPAPWTVSAFALA